jgi:hypothetical protein
VNRDEAVKVLREVLDACPSINGFYIALMPSNLNDRLSHGYQIHIKTYLTPKDRKYAEEILAKQGLALKETEGKTIIYRPIKKSLG